MAEERKVKILVDDFSDLAVKGAMPGGLVGQIQRVVDLDVAKLKPTLQSAFENVIELIPTVPDSADTLEVSSIKFSLQIAANGEVSLLSLAKGGISATSGIEFTVTKKT